MKLLPCHDIDTQEPGPIGRCRVPSVLCLSIVLLILMSWACAGPPRRQVIAAEDGIVRNMPPELIREFKAECSRLLEQPATKPGGIRLGREGWCYQDSELIYGAAGAFFGDGALKIFPDIPIEKADPIGAILRFQDQLARFGIRLYLMPVPDRPVIYPEGILDLGRLRESSPLPLIKPELHEFMNLLRDAGVPGIDLTPFFLGERDSEHGPLFLKSDLHWSPAATALASRIVAGRIRKQPWYLQYRDTSGSDDASYTAVWKTTTHFGHIYERLRDLGGVDNLQAEALEYREIDGPGIRAERISGRMRHPHAPVIVIGDSNTPKWNALYASFSQELAYELKMPVDTISASDGGINEARLNLLREYRSNPEYFEGKKALIWVFTIRAVLKLQAGWIDIPLVPVQEIGQRGEAGVHRE